MSTTTNGAQSIPVNPETGEPFLYSMRLGSQRIDADRNDHLVAAVLGEHYLDEDDPDTRFEVRLEGALMLANVVQESVVASAIQRDDLSPEDGEDVWTPLMAQREVAEPADGLWEHHVPLVLVTSMFEPHSSRERPSGNIVWIDPTDDITLLETLQSAGLISVIEHDQIGGTS